MRRLRSALKRTSAPGSSLSLPIRHFSSLSPATTPPTPLSSLPSLPLVGSPPLDPLTDLFHRRHTYLRVSLTERCSLRCVYCMPAEGIELTQADKLLTTAEITKVSPHPLPTDAAPLHPPSPLAPSADAPLCQLLSWFVSHGVTKVRFTGGEPLVRRDVVDVVAAAGRLRPLGLSTVGLTTNGLVLERKLPALIAAGLTHVNLSLDTLDPLKFQLIARRPGHSHVLSALHAALASPSLRSVKLNCVVMKGINDDELLAFTRLTQHLDLEVRFIEYMPFDGNRWSDKRFLAYRDMKETIMSEYPTLKPVESAGGGEVSKVWRVEGWKGRVGFISSMSDHFCASCSRLRVTADGQLKVCLFDNKEVSLRDAMREGAGDTEMSELIGRAVRGKKAAHAGMFELAKSKNRSMIRIGG